MAIAWPVTRWISRGNSKAGPPRTAVAAVPAGMTNARSAGGADLQASEAVVHQSVGAGHLGGELDHGGTTRGDRDCLHVVQRLGGALRVDAVEDLADHVEAGAEIRPAHPEEDPHRLADPG